MIIDTPITKAQQAVANSWTGLDPEDTVYVTFTHDGPVLIGENASPKYDPPENLVLVEVSGRLTVAGSSATNVMILKNGGLVGNLHWDSSEDYVTMSMANIAFSANTDLLQVQCDAAGLGAIGISIRFRFQRED